MVSIQTIKMNMSPNSKITTMEGTTPIKMQIPTTNMTKTTSIKVTAKTTSTKTITMLAISIHFNFHLLHSYITNRGYDNTQ